MKKIVTINSFKRLKEGQTNGRTWTLFLVNSTDADGEPFDFTSFGKKYKWEDHIGKTIEADFREKINGQFRNWSIVEDDGARRGGNSEEVMSALRIILEKVENIERLVGGSG